MAHPCKPATQAAQRNWMPVGVSADSGSCTHCTRCRAGWQCGSNQHCSRPSRVLSCQTTWPPCAGNTAHGLWPPQLHCCSCQTCSTATCGACEEGEGPLLLPQMLLRPSGMWVIGAQLLLAKASWQQSDDGVYADSVQPAATCNKRSSTYCFDRLLPPVHHGSCGHCYGRC